MRQLNATEIIKILQLREHPEGGFYREVYRCKEIIDEKCLPDRYTGERAFGTAIYFLLTDSDISAFHKIKSDETWHFYTGQSLTLYQIDSAGHLKKEVLGMDIFNDERPQITIEKETYFGAKVNGKGFCLAGCTVAPGFDFADFDMPGRGELLTRYPQHEGVIDLLT